MLYFFTSPSFSPVQLQLLGLHPDKRDLSSLKKTGKFCWRLKALKETKQRSIGGTQKSKVNICEPLKFNQ